ncbi:MAG TPA: thioredoxin domain-containing protein, partial [Polyangiaceae bacterium]|nr:thioredoxin domain-containing protein [Polyangiaceae bacterium]
MVSIRTVTQKLPSLLLIALAASVVGCASSQKPAAPATTQWLSEGIRADAHPGAQSTVVPIDDDDAVWGSGLAPVTIVAFLDFQCPFCRASHPTLNALLQKYGPAKLRFVFKHYPLPSHEGGVAAALAAQAVNDVAGAKAFFAYQNDLYS